MRHWWSGVLACGGLVLLGAGCAGRGPTVFPMTPLRSEAGAGLTQHFYDVAGGGRADYRETVDAGGALRGLAWDRDGDGVFEEVVRRDAAPSSRAARRHLLIILDSIPVELVRTAQRQGRFAGFGAPAAVISPFPVMTDTALVEFLHMPPCPGMESQYFDGQRLTDGLEVYLAEENAPWIARMDFDAESSGHAWMYLAPYDWFNYELGEIQRRFAASAQPSFMAYVMSTSGTGSKYGYDGHQVALLRLERFCQRLMHDHRGALEITLMSDHGHARAPNRRTSLRKQLADAGYRAGERLEHPDDVVVPEFGLVSYAGVYTRAPQRVARDLVGFEGVELALYKDSDRVVVLSTNGEAHVTCDGARYGYQPVSGDPLKLVPLMERLRASGAVDADGVGSDSEWRAALLEHVYPDALYRVWRAFDNLVQHPPAVLVSLADGWYSGSADLEGWLRMQSVHGNLRTASSYGFAMTTLGDLPPTLRMRELLEALRAVGAPLPATQTSGPE